MNRIDDLRGTLTHAAEAATKRSSSDPQILNGDLRIAGEESGLGKTISAIDAALPESTLVSCNRKLQSLLSSLTSANPSSDTIQREFKSFLQATPSTHNPMHCGIDCNKINALLRDFRTASSSEQDDSCHSVARTISQYLPVVLERHTGRFTLSILDNKGCRTLLASPNQSAQIAQSSDKEIVARDPFSQETVKIKHFTRGELHGAERADREVKKLLDKLGEAVQQCSAAMAEVYEEQTGKPLNPPEDGIGTIVADGVPISLDNLHDDTKRDATLSAIASSASIKASPTDRALVKVRNQWIPAQLWVNQNATLNLTKRDVAIHALEQLELPSENGTSQYEKLLDTLDPTKQKITLQRDFERKDAIARSQGQIIDAVSRKQLKQTCDKILYDALSSVISKL